MLCRKYRLVSMCQNRKTSVRLTLQPVVRVLHVTSGKQSVAVPTELFRLPGCRNVITTDVNEIGMVWIGFIWLRAGTRGGIFLIY
jgi:hypothetical protein